MTTLHNQPVQRAVIYTRISRDDSGEGRSNQRQEEACRMFASMRGWEVVAVENDISTSAYNETVKRPGWDRVKGMMRSGECDVVVAWKLDRITRRVKGLIDLVTLANDTGVSFAMTDGMLDLTSPTGKAVATILGAVAEMEVELKAERQRLGNSQRRAEGERWRATWRAFGYDWNEQGEYVQVPREAEAIRQAAEDLLKGVPLRAIARQWREAGLDTPRSKKGAEGWTHHGVRSVLLNPRNAGLNTYKGEVVGRGKWEPIISEARLAEITAYLKDPSRRTNNTTASRLAPKTLLSGIATCYSCGEAVGGGTVARMKDGESYRFPVYRCPSDHLSTYRDEMDALVRSLVAGALLSEEAEHLMLTESVNTKALSGHIEELRDRLDGAARSYSIGAIDEKQLAVISEGLRKQIADAEERMNENVIVGPWQSALRWDRVQRFQELELLEQRAILMRHFAITLKPKGRGNHRGVSPLRQLDLGMRLTDEGGAERVKPLMNGEIAEQLLSQQHDLEIVEGGGMAAVRPKAP